MHRHTILLSVAATLAASVVHAQMSMPLSHQAVAPPQPASLVENELQHTTSGTSVQTAATSVPMLMQVRSGWTLMLHGLAFAADTQQVANSGRGADKLFSTNWVMPMAQHRLGSRGQITVRTMLSLEPATITGRYYPELFQQGETAYGKAIVDGQHPHDLVMELAALYDLRLGTQGLLSLYAAPVGDPAIGPTAYPHRASAAEDQVAALGHHQEDSTHIAFNVFTAGMTYRSLRLEGSGFHGAEPTEARWHLQPSPNGLAVDSAAARLTWAPAPNLAAQYSVAQITSPEALLPGENQRRQTASWMYSRSVGGKQAMAGMAMPGDTPPSGTWATTLLWGQTRNERTGDVENSYLLESLLQFRRRNNLWTRIESAGRTSELDGVMAPAVEHGVGQVQAYSVGFDRDYRILPKLLSAPGAQFTVYRTPDALAPVYGRDPLGAVLFVRFRLATH